MHSYCNKRGLRHPNREAFTVLLTPHVMKCSFLFKVDNVSSWRSVFTGPELSRPRLFAGSDVRASYSIGSRLGIQQLCCGAKALSAHACLSLYVRTMFFVHPTDKELHAQAHRPHRPVPASKLLWSPGFESSDCDNK